MTTYPVTNVTAATFANPPAADRPWVRWNILPETTPAELTTELNQMHDAGISGAELGQGTFPSITQLTAILTTANALGMKISLAHGPTQFGPSSNPDTYVTAYSINDNNSRASLVYGKTTVAVGATYTGVVPSPGTSANTTTLLAVLAYQCVASPCPASGTVSLIQSSEVDLTATVTGTNTSGRNGGSTAGNISWTAPASPAGASWQLISVWIRGVQAQPDEYSAAGLAIEENAMTSFLAPVASLMQANGGDFFYDSHSSDRGSPTELWTNDMRAQFQSQKGYDIVPFLPALSTGFAFSDGSTNRIVSDMASVRTNLWLSNQVLPLQAWAHSTYGWEIRLQPYGEGSAVAIDQTAASQFLDHPETETLFYRDDSDAYRPMSSANHITGNPWLSIEGAATLNQAYGQDWQDLLVKLNAFFVGGGTKQVFHIWATAYSNTSLWPGYSYFNQGFSNQWGPQEPYWADAAQNMNYIARNQQVLSQGMAKVDVAIYAQNYRNIGAGGSISPDYWPDLTLEQAGYTRDYLNDSLLKLPQVAVSGGVLDAAGPAYKAFIIDSTLQPPNAYPSKLAMPIAAAQQALGFAQAGLPIIVVGTPPNATPGNTPGADASLQAVIAQLLAQPSVHQVATEAAVPAMLASLAIQPNAQPTASGNIESVRRTTADTDYYFLYNQTTPKYSSSDNVIYDQPLIGTAVDTQLSLVGTGRPYMLDAWSGAVTPIADYQTLPGRVLVHVKLAPEQTTLIALTTNDGRFTTATHALHATSVSGDVVFGADGNPAIRATANGSQTVSLSDGRTLTVPASNVPAAVDLSTAAWHLSVEDWQPTNPYATTTGQTATQTTKVPHEIDVTSLKTWPNIPELQDVSGIGTYSTTFTLPAGWRSDNGAYLNLGTIFDSFTVTVNGHALAPVNAASRSVDVGPYVHAGSNSLAIRVTTTLRNRLRLYESTQASRPRQPYGLTGPVVIQPYEQINLVGTTTTVAATYDPTQYGKSTTLTATVAPNGTGGPVPTGTVQFSLDGAPFGAPVALVGGVATYPASPLMAIGTHTVSAVYSGDANWLASTSPTINHSVKKRLATTTAVTSAGPVTFSQPWALTTTITPENASIGSAPTGTLELVVDGAKLTTGSPPVPVKLHLPDDTVTTAAFTITIHCTWPPLSCTITINWASGAAIVAGNHGVRAVYSGDTANYTGSTSPTYTQQVKKASPTGTVVSDLPGPIRQADRPTFTATFVNPVAPAGSLAPANVQFLIDGTNMGAPVAISATPTGGTASFKTTWSLPLGTHTIKAKYLGNANFVAVFSTGLSLTINP